MRRCLVALAFLLAAPLAAQEETSDRIQWLVGLLGSEDGDLREAASQDLLAIGRPAAKALREAAKGGTKEVRERAGRLYRYARWGVGEGCPDSILDQLGEFETSDAVGKAQVLRELAKLSVPAAWEALCAAWWDVDDPAILVELASVTRSERMGSVARPCLDPDKVEERLKAVMPDDDPRILLARASARVECGDDAAACELYARCAKLNRDPHVLSAWGRTLFHMHRCAEAAAILSGCPAEDYATTRLRVESLYRAGQTDAAEAALAAVLPRQEREHRLKLQELALSYGSFRFLTEPNRDIGGLEPEIAAQAWMSLGKLDRAEEVWRGMSDGDERRRIFGLLLDARGEASLQTPAFEAEALSAQPADAARHRRLAQSLESDDHAMALREWRKARWIDPSHEECAQAIDRLGARPADAAGVWSGQAPAPSPHLVFATSPVRLGDFHYYMNQEGDLLKVRDPLHPDPAWTYSPPRTGDTHARGIAFARTLHEPKLARRGAELLALFYRQASFLDPAQGGVSAWGYGWTLCVLEDATGREEWTREFWFYGHDAHLWPEEGVLTIEHDGVMVFDLATRAWRWSLFDLEAGSPAVLVHGDGLYLGFASGVLCRLRLLDGGLVWRKKWPGGEIDRELQTSGSRLLFRTGGQRLVALSLEDDSLLWETQSHQIYGVRMLVDAERAYLCSSSGRCIEAVSLSDGKLAWEQSLRGTQQGLDPTLTDHVLWFGRPGHVCCVDKASGSVLGAAWSRGGAYPNSIFSPGGDTLYASTARERLAGERSEDSQPLARLLMARCEGRTKAPPTSLPNDKNVRAEVSLLDDACSGAAGHDGAAWLALADACLRAGHAEWAGDALRRGVLLAKPDLQEVRKWQGRIAEGKAGSEEENDGRREIESLRYFLKGEAEALEFEEAFREGKLPPHEENPAHQSVEFSHLVLDPSAESTVRRALALARDGFGFGASTLIARRLGDVPEALALEGAEMLISDGLQSGSCSRLWTGSLLWGSFYDTTDIESALRERLAGPPSALRGAALTVLELLGVGVPEEGAEASLRAAFSAKEPRVRLAAAAGLARRGVAEGKESLLDALESDDKVLRSAAAWLAGNLRLAEAVPSLRPGDGEGRQFDLEALAEIGSEEAWKKVLHAGVSKSPYAEWNLATALWKARSSAAVQALAARMRPERGFEEAYAGFWGLIWMDTRAAHLASLPFARTYLRLDPMSEGALLEMAKGLLDLGDVAEAERCMARIEVLFPRSPWVLALGSRLLATKGDLDGAREQRRLAVECYARAEAVRPGSYRHLLEEGRLFLEPAAIADAGKARELLERARTMAPRDPEVLRLLELAPEK